MTYERLIIQVLPRLKVIIRIVTIRIVYEFNLIPHIYGLDWIGLDWVSKHGHVPNFGVPTRNLSNGNLSKTTVYRRYT